MPSYSESAPPKAALVDLDGTLISASSEKELLVSLARGGHISARGLLRFLAAYALHPLRTLSRGKGWNRSYLRGMDPDLLEGQCSLLAEELRRRVRPEVSELVGSWSEGGTRVVLISASLQPLASQLASLCGASRVVASVPEVSGGRLTGALSGPRPWGRRKAELARAVLGELAVPASEAAALGDSWSDRHVLRLCGRPVAVSPGRRLRRLAEAEGWRVMEGRRAGWA
ncbi:MAG: HAD-IB family phosphatase [Candidatus Fermentibacteraceae bacterium]